MIKSGHSFRKFAQSTARKVLPPALLQGAREVRRMIRSDKPIRVPGTNRFMSHRGTEADTDLFDQIFLAQVYGLRFLRRFGEIERFYDNCAKPLVVDCGANIGASALWFATRFPRSAVVAIEPETGNFEILEKNSEGLNVRAVHGAVASQAGYLRLVDPGMGSCGFRTELSGEASGDGAVRAYTLDELADLAPDHTPFILKIDIEGAESDLFRSHQRTLDLYPVVIVELHDWMLPRSGSSQSFLKWHVAQDRDLVQHGENTYSLCNRRLPAIA
jgi:FkbM family methyltransferase